MHCYENTFVTQCSLELKANATVIICVKSSGIVNVFGSYPQMVKFTAVLLESMPECNGISYSLFRKND